MECLILLRCHFRLGGLSEFEQWRDEPRGWDCLIRVRGHLRLCDQLEFERFKMDTGCVVSKPVLKLSAWQALLWMPKLCSY